MSDRPSRSFMRFQWRVHRLIWNLTGGRLGGRVIGMPVLELVTTGHKSGEPRSILLTYVETPTGPAVAGSNAGADHDPAWVRNLRADPAALLRTRGKWREATARFLDGGDWDRVWSQFLDHRGYAGYREMTDRHIPLILLETGA